MFLKFDNFFTSTWIFDESEADIKSKFQMINIAIILSSLSLIYGIIGNIIRNMHHLVPLELFLLLLNIILFFILRRCKKSFTNVATIITSQFTFFFLYLVYTSDPSSLKHVWIFTYPVILLYLQSKRAAIYWFSALLIVLIIAPIQPIVAVKYSFYQVTYIAFVLLILSVIVNFYELKMEEAKKMIQKQQVMLQQQAKQAVMGEMISMIAHQWRQPLSTVTLSISNLQIKKLLGVNIEDKEFDTTLENISDTVVYLSNTIDDFQTYFNPNKEITKIEIHELINKSVNFALPRLQDTKIKIEVDTHNTIVIQTYINELVQVLLNLLNNAIDALLSSTTPNPTISLSVKEQDQKVFIVLEDNADGINEETLPHIFNPYFSTKGKNGTGLGLYMSQMIVQKQFNGTISVESSPKGTKFKVEIQKEIQ